MDIDMTDYTQPQGPVEMWVTLRAGKVVAVSEDAWNGVALQCPNRIKNRLVPDTPTLCSVDPAAMAVVDVVTNPAMEDIRETAEGAEFRTTQLTNWLANEADPRLVIINTARKHFAGTEAELYEGVRYYLRNWKSIDSVKDDFSFGLRLIPPDDHLRYDDDDEDEWTLGGSIDWTDPNQPKVVVWHFGPSTAVY